MRKLGIIVLAVATMATATVAMSQTAATAAVCEPKPVVREVSVNQGLGSYDKLARDKTTLVRLFLSLPECAPSTWSMSVRPGSTLQVDNGTIPAPPALAPVSPTTEPSILRWEQAPAADHAADLKFVIPGSLVDPTALLTVSGTINYTANGIAGSLPFGPAAKAVEVRVKPLRVLVVPLGDASKDYSTQFTSNGVAAVETGMEALSRMMPVADGITSLTGADSGAGLRYSILPTLLDIKALMTNKGKFCGSITNFDPIKRGLAALLNQWNSDNPAAPADRVVGAADAAVALGTADGCAEGWATVPGSLGWVRAVPDATGAPSATGSLLGMELGHTFGLVPLSRDDISDTAHSPSTQADGTAPDRGYNLTTKGYVHDDRSVMKLTAGAWNNQSTLLEQKDWAFAQCVLGGTSTECVTEGGQRDATVGATPKRVFVLSGTVTRSGTATTADVVDSYTAQGRPTVEPDASEFTLVQLAATTVKKTTNVHVAFDESSHEHGDGGDGTDHAHSGVFRASVELLDDIDRIELRAGTEVLYSRDVTETPVVLNATATYGVSEAVNLSESPADDNAPSLSPDGRLVAWASDGGVHVKVAGGTAGVVIADAGEPALGARLSDTGSEWPLAFTRNGSVFIQTMALTADGPAAVGEPREIYTASLTGSDPTSALQARHPALSVDDRVAAFEIGGDIFTVDLVGNFRNLPCDFNAQRCPVVPVTATPAIPETWPTFSQDPGEADRIAYVRDRTVYARRLDVTGAPLDAVERPVVADATQPSWGNGVMVYRGTAPTAPGIHVLETAVAGAVPTRLTAQAADAAPAIAGSSGGTIVLERPLPTADSPREIISFRLRTVVEWNVRDDQLLHQLRGAVSIDCTGARLPLVAGLTPVESSEEHKTARFRFEWDAFYGCTKQPLVAFASDGFTRSIPSPTAPVGPGTEPIPAIASPVAGTTAPRGDVVAAVGSALDGGDGHLDGNSLSWVLTRDGSEVKRWTGERLDLVGLAPGRYDLTLTATDGVRSATTATWFVVLDRWMSVRRPATTNFDPDVLNVPSNGNTVTFHLAGAGLSEIDPATVRLVDVGGVDVSGDTRFAQMAWTITSSGVTAKFDRQALERFVADEHDFVGSRIPITLAGDSKSGVDPWRLYATGTTYVTRST